MVNVLKVSVTELQEFMRCGRMWDLQSSNRQSLVRRGAPRKELWIGSAMHAALGAQIMGQDPMEALSTYIEKTRVETAEEYLRRVGAPMSPEEWVTFDESAEMCWRVLANYFLHYGSTETYSGKPGKHPKLRPLAAEITFMIPLPIDLSKSEYDVVYLVGTVDALFLDPMDNLVIGDHKTFSQKADVRDLQCDHQFIGYAACVEVLTGVAVDHFLYNGVNKKVPGLPAVLKGEGPTKGRLSKAWIDTTYSTYRQAIVDNNEDPTDAYYSGHLARLLERDTSNNVFFIRHYLDVYPSATRQWWDNTIKILTDMAHDPQLTFHRAWGGCWDCGVRDLCDAMLKGQDVEWLKNADYVIGTYGTKQALETTVSPETVGSLDDLIAFAKKQHEKLPETTG
jgi:hypothetical protein